MSSYPPPIPSNAPDAHFPPLPPQYPRQKNWFDRNWKWFIPTVVVALLLVVGGFVGAIFYGVTHMFTGSEPYKVAVDRAMKSPAVQENIGTPMKVGWFTSGNENLNGPSGSASLSISLTGPKGSGTIYVEAKKRAGTWRYETLEFAPASGARIPLLDSSLPQIPPLARAAPDGASKDDGST
jgi:hypothetical protein